MSSSMYAKIETEIRFFVLNITMRLSVRKKRIIYTFCFLFLFYSFEGTVLLKLTRENFVYPSFRCIVCTRVFFRRIVMFFFYWEAFQRRKMWRCNIAFTFRVMLLKKTAIDFLILSNLFAL